MLQTDKASIRLAVTAAFVIGLAILGGTSRNDAWQGVALMPLAWLVAAWAWFAAYPERRRALRPAWLWLSALFLLMALQLVPLPPAVWQSLPDRDLVAALDNALGLTAWRPLSLAPSATLSSLLGLGVPAAALALVMAGGSKRAVWAVRAVVILASMNAVLGLLQIIGPDGGPLRWYEYTIESAAVGIFANPNHSATFGALGMICAAWLASSRPPVEARLAIAGAMLMALAIIVNPSRTGIFVLAISGVCAGFIAWRSGALAERRGRWVATLFAVLVILFLAAMLLADRIPVVERVLRTEPLDDIRLDILPVLLDMAGRHAVFGTGFGSFEQVHYIYETDATLGPAYLNQAHNDWLQWVIEGGLAAILLLAALLAATVRTIGKLWRAAGADRTTAVAATGMLLVLATASITDYPLRTPLFQAVVAALFGFGLSRLHTAFRADDSHS